MSISSDRSGRLAENIASMFLRLKGFRIVQQRYATKVGEIDIVANKRDLLVFVEVKLRSGKEAALFSIGPHQQQRITRAASAFLKENPHFALSDIRFDVVAFGRWTWPTHIEDAWRAAHF